MIAWFARHQTAANLLMVAIMLLGLVALPGLLRETFPDLENEEVQVSVLYRGATPQEVEDAICRRLEDVLEGITNLDEMRCEALEGLGKATAVKQEGADMMRFLNDVKSEVEAISDFPDDTEKPVVTELGRTERVISIALTGPDDPVALKDYAEDLKTRLLASTKVAEVAVNGFSDHHIRIEVPAWRLHQYGLSAADIASAVSRHNVGGPTGRLEGSQEDLLLRFDDQRKTAEAFRSLVVISGKTGASIPLGDVAEITDRFDRDEDKIYFNGKRAALLDVSKTKSQDVLKVRKAISDFVDQERILAPRGVTLDLTQDIASVVQDRLNLLLRNSVQGLIFVFLVLWLFFSIRYSFWVVVGLPVSFLGALFLLPMLGITLNMISMVGLLIGVGILMDDAIVLSENIAARMARGDSPMHAAITGTKQVMPGILSSFATTLLVFGSLAFISGQMGQVLRVLPMVLILVVTISLIEAFWILPHHLAHSLSHMKQQPASRFRIAFEQGFDGFRERWFGALLDRSVEYRYFTLGMFILLMTLAISMMSGGKLKFVGFPELDGDVVEARILLPQGTPLARTESVVARMESALASVNDEFRPRQPDGQDLVRNVSVIFGNNPDAYETGPHVARVVVDLLSAEVRDAALTDFFNAWRTTAGEFADVISIKYTEPSIGPGGRPIDLRLLGPDLMRLKSASQELQDWLNQYEGVQDLSDDLRPGKREFRLRLKPGAGELGLDARMVTDQLRGAFQGIKVDEFPLGSETYEVNLRIAAEDRSGPQNVQDFAVISPQGAQVPLSIVAQVEEDRGWARIHRINRQRAITVQGDVDRNLVNAQQLVALAKSEFIPGLLERYPDIHFDVQGESDESAKTGASIARNVLLGLVGIYMLLAMQFRGYLAPVTVMLVIPTALIGVVFGHMLLGLDMTMPSIVGMASLFGVVVNDSILLVVFIREEREQGIPALAAAKLAARARFRPILLTTLTTVAGLTPLLLEKSMQAQILIPLATSLAFGLATATIAALFLVPAVYVILDDFDLLGAIGGEAEKS